MANEERELSITELLQASIDHFEANELPILNAFEQLLIEQARLLRDGTISEREFFETLTTGEPLTLILVRSRNEDGYEEQIEVERTTESKIRVRTHEAGSFPDVTTTIGLSESGELQVEDIHAEYLDPEGLVEPHVVEGDRIYSDIISPNSEGKMEQQSTPKQEAGEWHIELLKDVVAWEN
ncbi:hypothetical protein HYZ78_01655 [Candidatus Microgenomates bacterium]|nr:hypothetical protein [Candidatus Microgenomates bacterium]